MKIDKVFIFIHFIIINIYHFSELKNIIISSSNSVYAFTSFRQIFEIVLSSLQI